MAKEIDISNSRDPDFFMIPCKRNDEETPCTKKDETNSPIPSVGAAINPKSDLAKN